MAVSIDPLAGGMTVEHTRGDADPALPRWLRRVLGVSLPMKLVGANLVVAAAAAVALGFTSTALADQRAVLILAAALLVAILVNATLVVLALRPVREIERVAERVSRGDFAARVAPSATADADTARLGRTFNLLLDSLESDRERLRELAARTIRAQDEERSRIARELHDSAAQSIAALSYQLAAAARDAQDAELAARLADMRNQAGDVLEEVRVLSHVVHPRVLEDLGLAAALDWLARTVSEHGPTHVTVKADHDAASGVARDVAAALYRVAQESLRNVERHAGAQAAHVSLVRADGMLVLEVADDGRGFSLRDAEARRPGMGIFAMRERVALVDGNVDIDTAPGRGTRVRACVPVATPARSLP
jgi:signal transduction histidine kinase